MDVETVDASGRIRPIGCAESRRMGGGDASLMDPSICTFRRSLGRPSTFETLPEGLERALPSVRWEATKGHLMSAGHTREMASWQKRGRPQIIIPQRFSDRERLEIYMQLQCSQLSDRQLKAALERILQLEWYRGQTGRFTGEIPPETTTPRGIWIETTFEPHCGSCSSYRGPDYHSKASQEAERGTICGRCGSFRGPDYHNRAFQEAEGEALAGHCWGCNKVYESLDGSKAACGAEASNGDTSAGPVQCGIELGRGRGTGVGQMEAGLDSPACGAGSGDAAKEGCGANHTTEGANYTTEGAAESPADICSTNDGGTTSATTNATANGGEFLNDGTSDATTGGGCGITCGICFTETTPVCLAGDHIQSP